MSGARISIVGVVAAVALSGCGARGTKPSATTYPPQTPPSTFVSESASPSPIGAKQFAFGDVVKVRGQAPAGWAVGATASPGQASNDGNITVSAPTFSVRDKAGKGDGYDFSAAAKNGVFAVFSVTALGVSGQFYINAYDFYVRGADGTHYTNAIAIFDPAFRDGRLSPGEPLKGNISFDIPDKTGILVYSPTGMPALGEWKFNG